MYRSRFSNKDQEAKFSDAILNIVVDLGGANGIAISYLLSEVRETWKSVASSLSEFECILEDLGFTIVHIYSKKNSAVIHQTNITV